MTSPYRSGFGKPTYGCRNLANAIATMSQKNIATKFTNRLQNLLDYYSLSASGLATKIGIQRSTISHVVSGRNKPSLDFVMKILHTFNEVTIEWLIDGKGSFPKLENSSINKIVKTIENPSPTFTKKIESERNENITDAVSELEEIHTGEVGAVSDILVEIMHKAYGSIAPTSAPTVKVTETTMVDDIKNKIVDTTESMTESTSNFISAIFNPSPTPGP